jgi:hypothetical protein
MPKPQSPSPRSLHCSFCGKSEHEIARLVAGPGAIKICNECVAACQVIMDGQSAPERSFEPATWPTERLMALLPTVEATSQLHRAHLQAIVDALRGREVSWAAIAEQLGVSRQSAWERFS